MKKMIRLSLGLIVAGFFFYLALHLLNGRPGTVDYDTQLLPEQLGPNQIIDIQLPVLSQSGKRVALSCRVANLKQRLVIKGTIESAGTPVKVRLFLTRQPTLKSQFYDCIASRVVQSKSVDDDTAEFTALLTGPHDANLYWLQVCLCDQENPLASREPRVPLAIVKITVQ